MKIQIDVPDDTRAISVTYIHDSRQGDDGGLKVFLMTREEILDAARAAVNGEQNHEYGSPEEYFQVIADRWKAYLEAEDQQRHLHS